MRITIVQGAFLPIPPLLGGAVEKMWHLISQEFAKQGHEVIYFSRKFKGLSNSETVNGVKHIRVKGYETPRSLLLLKIFDLLYSFRVKRKLLDSDILVTNTFWLPLLMPGKKKGKLYVDVARMPKGQMKFYGHVSRLRANSSAVEKAIHLEFEGGVSLTRVIPNPLTFLMKGKVSVENKLNTILYVGRIHKEKGIELLIKGFLKAVELGLKEYKLKIIGPYEVFQGGGGREFMESLRDKYSNDNIEFIDPIFELEKLNLEYQKASIFVYPSLAEKGETFGISPLESMAWGCIPIVSSLDCFKDFIENGSNGFIFDHRSKIPEEELATVLIHLDQMDNKTKNNIREKCLLVSQSHSIENVAGQFLNDFNTIINSN